MKQRYLSVVTALPVLTLGSSFITGCANPWATRSFNSGLAKLEKGDQQGAISAYNKAIEINPQNGLFYSNRAISGYHLTGDFGSACKDIKKAASLGNEYRVNWLNSEEGKWCRDM